MGIKKVSKTKYLGMTISLDTQELIRDAKKQVSKNVN